MGTIISRFVLANLSIIVSPLVVFSGLIIAVVVGVLGGIIPANKASKLSPVEALRYS
jgi:putative ABC transport system permease protein